MTTQIKTGIKNPFIRVPLEEVEPGIFAVKENSVQSLKKHQLQAKRNSQNRLAIQEMVLITLLNHLGYEFYLSKPYKKSTTTMQYLHVDKIKKDGDVKWDRNSIDVSEKNSKEKKILYDTTITNLMISLLQYENIYFKERVTRKGLKKDFVQLKRLEYIEWKKGLIYLNQCYSLGINVYTELQRRMMKESIVVLPKDDFLNHIFFTFCETSSSNVHTVYTSSESGSLSYNDLPCPVPHVPCVPLTY